MTSFERRIEGSTSSHDQTADRAPKENKSAA